MIKTVENATQLLTKSWTVRLAYLATLLEAAGQVWPLIEPHVQILVEPQVFHTLAAICVAAIPLARVIKQGNLP